MTLQVHPQGLHWWATRMPHIIMEVENYANMKGNYDWRGRTIFHWSMGGRKSLRGAWSQGELVEGKTPRRMLATNRGVVFEQRISTPKSQSKQKLIVSSLRLFFSKKPILFTDYRPHDLSTLTEHQGFLTLFNIETNYSITVTSTSIEPTLAKRRFKKYQKTTKKSKVFIYYLKFSMCSLKSWMQVRILTLYLGSMIDDDHVKPVIHRNSSKYPRVFFLNYTVITYYYFFFREVISHVLGPREFFEIFIWI